MPSGSVAGADAASRESVRFPVHGMTCTSCVVRITRALRAVDGVSGVRVDLGREIATVIRVGGRASDDKLAAAVAEAGYQADFSAAAVLPAAVSGGLLRRLLGR